MNEFFTRTEIANEIIDIARKVEKQHRSKAKGLLQEGDIELPCIEQAYIAIKNDYVSPEQNWRGYIYRTMNSKAKSILNEIFDYPDRIPEPETEEDVFSSVPGEEEKQTEVEKIDLMRDLLHSVCSKHGVEYDDNIAQAIYNLKTKIGIKGVVDELGGKATEKHIKDLIKPFEGGKVSLSDAVREAIIQSNFKLRDIKKYLDDCGIPYTHSSVSVLSSKIRKELNVMQKPKNAKALNIAKELIRKNPNISLNDFSDALRGKVSVASIRVYYTMVKRGDC